MNIGGNLFFIVFMLLIRVKVEDYILILIFINYCWVLIRVKWVVMEFELDVIGLRIREEKGFMYWNGRVILRKMKWWRLVDKKGWVYFNYVNVLDCGKLYYFFD